MSTTKRPSVMMPERPMPKAQDAPSYTIARMPDGNWMLTLTDRNHVRSTDGVFFHDREYDRAVAMGEAWMCVQEQEDNDQGYLSPSL